MLTIGHRGAKGYEPENTLASFAKAIQMNVGGIEFDVHLSNDKHIVVIHDETVDRTTDGAGLVNELSLSELKRLNIGIHKIPTLDDVLEQIDKKCLVNIELKGNGTAEPVTFLIQKYVSDFGWKYTDFIVSSFDWNALQTVRNLDPQIPIGVLTATNLDLAIGFCEFIKAETIHPYFHLLTSENTAQMQQNGLRVFAWTINEQEDIEKINSYKVNGIITDFPDRV